MSKIGTVLELERNKVLVITGGCDFVFIKRKPDMFRGQQVKFTERDIQADNVTTPKKLFPIAAGVAAVFIATILLYFQASLFNRTDSTYAFVDMDINPSIELKIDKDEKVQKVIPINDDAKKVLDQITLKDLLVKDAIRQLIDKSKELGFVENETNIVVLVSAAMNEDYKEYSNSEEAKLEQIVESFEDINSSEDSSKLQLKTIKVAPETKKSADKNGLSMGRQAVYEQALEKGIDMTLDEAKNEKVSVLLNKLEGKESESETVISQDTPLPQITAVSTSTAINTTPTLKPTATPTPKPTAKSQKIVYDSTVPEVSGKINTDSITLNWTPVEGDDFQYYKVVISKSNAHPSYPDNGYLYAISDINTTTALINNKTAYNSGDFGQYLTPGQKYYFSVTAVYGDKKVPGNTISLVYPNNSATSSAPKVTGSISGSKITLKWTKANSAGFQYYKVVISKSNTKPKYPDDGYLYAITDINTTQAVIDNSAAYNAGDFGEHLTPGEKYYFSITYVYDSKKVYSNVLNLKYPASTSTTGDQATPKMTASVSGTKVILKWQPTTRSGFVYYKIVMSKSNAKPKYPDDGYLFYITDPKITEAVIEPHAAYNGGDFGGQVIPGEKYYFSITSVFNDTKFYGNTVYMTFPGG